MSCHVCRVMYVMSCMSCDNQKTLRIVSCISCHVFIFYNYQYCRVMYIITLYLITKLYNIGFQYDDIILLSINQLIK